MIVVEIAVVLATLSSMERPVKHEHVDFNVLRQGFKEYGHGQKFLVPILYLAQKLAKSAVVSDTMRQARAMPSL